jgi:hypothetical protein
MLEAILRLVVVEVPRPRVELDLTGERERNCFPDDRDVRLANDEQVGFGEGVGHR